MSLELTMSHMQWHGAIIALLAFGLVPIRGGDAPSETMRYVRSSGDKFVTECKFLIARQESGWTITSSTDRGTLQMEVETRYDAMDRPTAARAVVTILGKTSTVNVKFKDGKATVERAGLAPVEFDAPRGTIVTSAPDWSDVFLLCRRYDRQRKGKQEFPALWIHPTDAPQRLTFSIELQGADMVVHYGNKVELGRYMIRIRKNSGYLAWADAQGRMVRLIPLPAKDTATGLTLEGYEKSASGLRPTP